jgi:hypothetical protein
VKVTANGRQRFVVPVHLSVTGRARTAIPRLELDGARPGPVERLDILPEVEPERPTPNGYVEPIEDVLPVVDVPSRLEEPPPRRRPRLRDEPEPLDEPRRGGANVWLALLPVAFLIVGLTVTLARDLARWASTGGEGDPEFAAAGPPLLEIQYHEREESVALAKGGGVKPPPGVRVPTQPGIWDPSMRFGLVMAGPDASGQRKRLTFDAMGRTNNCCVWLDGNEWLFGERPFRLPTGQVLGNWPGRWHDMRGRLDRPLGDGRRSTWVYDQQQVYITQTVGLVPGAQSGRLDTCLIHYRIENRDRNSHTIGLRFLLDTFIGGNDGVPFLIPGWKQLCTTSAQFNTPAEVPDFIQARETENLAHPGTIAQIGFRLPGVEAPARVTLGAWPNPVLGLGCRQEKTLWTVPVLPIKSMPPGDSAVVIYWAERLLAPSASREVGFTYGLGNVASSEGGGRLAITAGGSFLPRGEFTVTAYVSRPAPGQSVTLQLPGEFTLVEGAANQPVPPLPLDGSSATSPVTWKVRAGPSEGAFTIKVRSSEGASQTQTIRIKGRGIFGS